MDEDQDVRKVAAGLAAFQNMLEYTKKIARADNSATVLHDTGLLQAEEMLEALINGRDSPFWRYLAGLRSLTRPQNAPASALEWEARARIVGAVRAYQQVHVNHDRDPAIRALLKGVGGGKGLEGPGWRQLRIAQVRGWDTQFQAQCNPRPDEIASAILEKAKTRAGSEDLPAHVLKVAEEHIIPIFAAINHHESKVSNQ